MADLSRVLQALGAILQGGGGTLTAIDEDRRKREREEKSNAYLESLIAGNKANQDRLAREDAMGGWVPGAPPPLGSLSVPNPMGSGPGIELAGRPDPRIQAGGMYRDPTVASPNEMIKLQEDMRRLDALTARDVTTLQGMPQFQQLDPVKQEEVLSIARTGWLPPDRIFDRLEAAGPQETQQMAFEAGQNLARKYGLDWDAEYIPGQIYTEQLDRLRGTEAGAKINRAINPPGSGGDGGMSQPRMVSSALGDAIDLATQRKTIDQITDALAPDYPQLTRGELRTIAVDAFREVRTSSGTGSNRVPSILEETDTGRMGGATGVDAILNRVGGITGGARGGSAFDKLMGGGQ